MPDEEPAAAPPQPGRGQKARTPLWVKISGAIGLGAVIAFIVAHLTGNGMVGH
jgi:hypothetical protein